MPQNSDVTLPRRHRGTMRRGRQNFELKLFGCKNLPYVGEINVKWWEKIFEVQKAQGGGGALNLLGAQKVYKKNQKNVATFFCLFRRQ